MITGMKITIISDFEVCPSINIESRVGSALLEPILLPLVEQVGPRATEVNDLGASIPLRSVGRSNMQ